MTDVHGSILRLALVASALVLPAVVTQAAGVAPQPSAGCRVTKLETGRGLQRTINIDGVSRAYILDVPDGIQPQKPVPLLFDFHGLGHSAAGLWTVSGFKSLAARDGVITVYPDGLPVHLLGRDAPGWEIFTTEKNRDVTFTRQLLAELERAYCIDRARVFSTGFSNGAYFNYVLACQMADRFAAVAPVSGGHTPGACDPARAVPVLIHHGRQDETVPVAQARAARDAWVQRDGCGAPVKDGCEDYRQCRDGSEVEYCEGDFAHRWPAEATERIWEFFRAHPMQK
jgi:polyhydroxybutyrate depolymerase